MFVFRPLALSLMLASFLGCGNSSEGSGASAAAGFGKPSAASSDKPAAATTAAAVTLPEGIIPVGKLVDAVKADAKAVTGKKVQIEGTYWGMSKETSEGKVTYSLEIVASKDEATKKALCHTDVEPKELPKADNQAHEQAIAITAEGTLETTMSGKPLLKGCTYKKK